MEKPGDGFCVEGVGDGLLCLEEENGGVTEVEVDEVLCFCDVLVEGHP
jgi:hypothetical protein